MKILHKLGLINLVVLGIIAILSPHEWHFLILTAAQLVFVPIVLNAVHESRRLVWFAIPAFLAVILIQLTPSSVWHSLLAGVYLVYTITVALMGVRRFLHRGFTHLEEFLIDLAMVSLAVGGMWFFAYEAGINTGFSPVITWLTAIHFHYAGFLLPVFVGLLGRVGKPKLYYWLAPATMIALALVALGITFSTTLELLSVLVYIFAIYGLIGISFYIKYLSNSQKWLFRLTFMALGVSIMFSLLYAYGNWSGNYTITIEFMIKFHGLTNALLFAGAGTLVAILQKPRPSFPVSKLRSGMTVGEQFLHGKTVTNSTVSGLVDDMGVYKLNIAPTIQDFYENTTDYRLWSSVKWKPWFKPFAALYKIISRKTQQINLPLSSHKVEMNGDVSLLNPELDSRERVRAWTRKIEGDTTFVALYSEHTDGGKTYMNIALPLPGSTMIGVLNLTQREERLILSSQKVGIYLAFKEYVMKLPLQEQFEVWETKPGHLQAEHRMWIFGLPFLDIHYNIERR
ncbi:YndJ family protein [Piscibacillus sp. B03]|uniref:YndJ family protein n=1 Tax=Piscibacillus sp. B03 TaxID=3457430 RepID=UPI003FCC6C37